MNPKLSIIMPCYNCTSTLEEAVKSINEQYFDFKYEVIMIDDGSTDGTLDLIIDLSKKYPNINYFVHEKNKGGGATRNTGIKNSTGDLIFCLDSDNILAPNTLNTIAKFIDQKKIDGAVIHERRFFSEASGISKYKSHWNTILDRSITFEDIWNGNNVLLDNFMYTRKSYEKAGGYQTEHGFDTQAFEMSYLAVNDGVLVCPGTIFYHRQKMKHKSYFERVYESGEFSVNYYLSIEKVLNKFSNKTIEYIINYDIFKNASIRGANLKADLDKLYKTDPNSFLQKNNIDNIFIKAVWLYNQHKYKEAIKVFESMLGKYHHSTVIKFNILRSKQGLLGYPHDKLTQMVYKSKDGSKLLRPQKDIFKKDSIVSRVIKFLKKIQTNGKNS